MRRPVLAMTLAVLCGAATIVVGTLAPASGDEGRPVHFVDTSPVNLSNFETSFSTVGGNCPATPPIATPCNSVARGAEPSPGAYDDTLSGDLQGTGKHASEAILSTTNHFQFVPLSFDVPYVTRQVYSPVTVEGCGTGTLTLQDEGNLNSGRGVWKIVPGSGTGDLVGITGGGTLTGQSPPPPTGNSTVTYDGHVRCGHSHNE